MTRDEWRAQQVTTSVAPTDQQLAQAVRFALTCAADAINAARKAGISLKIEGGQHFINELPDKSVFPAGVFMVRHL